MEEKEAHWSTIPRICGVCGAEYHPNVSNQKYCSPECTQRRLDENYAANQQRGRFIVFHRDEFSCIYCGRSPVTDKNVVLHLEHVVPRYRGGENRLSNLATSCARCNVEKGHEPLTESAQYKILSEIERRNEAGGFNSRAIIKVNE